MLRHSLLAATLILSTIVSAAAQPSVPELLPLARAIDLALAENRSVHSAALDVARARDETAATQTRRWPALEVNLLESMLISPIDFMFTRGSLGTYPNVGPIPDTDRAISTPRRPNTLVYSTVAQPLSQLHKIGLGVRAGELKTEAAQEALRGAQQDAVNDVTRLYYAIAQTQAALRAAEDGVTFLRELQRTTGNLVVQRVALTADGLDVDARLINGEYGVLTVRNALASQKEQLNHLLGRDVNADFRVVEVPDPADFELDLAAARTRALERRSELRQARLKVEMADYDRRLKKAEYIPEINLTFTYLSPFNIDFVPKNIAAVGVMGSWEPFDWGRRAREVAEKGRVVEQARTGVAEAESRVLIDVNTKFRQLQEARALVQVARAQRQAEGERLRVVKDRYGLKAALLKDVLEAATTHAEAERAYQQAVAKFWSARAEFDHALGEDVR